MMAEDTLHDMVLSCGSGISLDARFSQVMNVQEQVQAVGRGKQRLYVEGLCLDVEEVENQNILPRKSVKQRLGICGPGVQRGPSPQRVNLDSRPSGQILSWAAMEGQFLGGRPPGQCCQCGRLGLRLLGQGDGWESHALTARPPRRTSFTPNKTRKLSPFVSRPGFRRFTAGFRRFTAGFRRETGATGTKRRRANTRQHAPKQGLKKGFTRQAQVPTKEVLDQQLDDYMSMSKRYLDSQLDAYMALAGYLDGEDENKWLDIEGV